MERNEEDTNGDMFVVWKTQYCKNNNIPLLRIRYDQDIVGVLYEFLSQYNVISREAAS